MPPANRSMPAGARVTRNIWPSASANKTTPIAAPNAIESPGSADRKMASDNTIDVGLAVASAHTRCNLCLFPPTLPARDTFSVCGQQATEERGGRKARGAEGGVRTLAVQGAGGVVRHAQGAKTHRDGSNTIKHSYRLDRRAGAHEAGNPGLEPLSLGTHLVPLFLGLGF